jgi:homoserine dehydrogenase
MKKKIRLGLVGFGTVGHGALEILTSNRAALERRIGAAFEIAGICDLHPIPQKSLYVKDYNELIAREDIDIIVELIGGYEPARTLILDAIRAGKHIVTANKAVLAKYWDEIFTTASACGRLVYFEASVGGAIPVIQGLNEGLAANRIEEINGILNGTTNYILSEMTCQKVDFKEALQSAQKAGFAEADPSFDVKGIDTANKLAILSSLAWSSWVKVEDVDVKGITEVTEDDVYFAEKFGYVIKLIGSAQMSKSGLALSVQPCLIPTNHAFANVEKEYNAVLIHGDASEDIMFYGKGAGSLPAASAVVSDIIALSKQIASDTAGKEPYITYDPKRKLKILPPARQEGSYYLRFFTEDQPGVLSRISGILGKCRVSIASVYQEDPQAKKRSSVPIIMLTHHTLQGNLLKALDLIDNLPSIKAKTVKFKIDD